MIQLNETPSNTFHYISNKDMVIVRGLTKQEVLDYADADPEGGFMISNHNTFGYHYFKNKEEFLEHFIYQALGV